MVVMQGLAMVPLAAPEIFPYPRFGLIYAGMKR